MFETMRKNVDKITPQKIDKIIEDKLEIKEDLQKSGYTLRSRESHKKPSNVKYDDFFSDSVKSKKKKMIKKTKQLNKDQNGKKPRKKSSFEDYSDSDESDDGADENGVCYYDKVIMAKLPPSINKLKGLSKLLDRKIDHYKSCYYKENEENKTKKSLVQD